MLNIQNEIVGSIILHILMTDQKFMTSQIRLNLEANIQYATCTETFVMEDNCFIN